MKNKLRVVVLGAGFGGLEISSILSDRLGENLDLTLIDKNDFFYFGFAKLDVMFGRKQAGSVKYPYEQLIKPGVTFRQEIITSIDPEKKIVTTQDNKYKADVIVIALGADYDMDATPGLVEGGNEFYSFWGAEKVAEIMPGIKKGNIIVGVTSFPFKCPPAPSEAALLVHDYLKNKGVREHCNISLVMPFELPIPPSYGTSKALLKAFYERDINYIPEIMVASIDPARKLAVLDDGREMPFDLFLGIPEHKAPEVLKESGLLFNDWIPVSKTDLKTKYPNVYAIGDVNSVGTPKSGVFAERAALTAAESIIAEYNGREFTGAFDGKGTCYVEFGEGKVGRVDVDFFSSPSPKGIHRDATTQIAEEKKSFEMIRRSRWFGK